MIFFICLILFFITGCAPVVLDKNEITSTVAQTPGILIAASSSSSENYQYSSPWDASAYDNYFAQAVPVSNIGEVKGGIVPHHLLAGYIPATFFNYLKTQKPSVIILVSPNHYNRGVRGAITSVLDWRTVYGDVACDRDLVNTLVGSGQAAVDETVMKEEHGIYGLMPFIAKTLPGTKVVPIIFKWQTPTSTVDKVIAAIADKLPPDAVVVASVDFSHYQTWPVANFHDELSRSVIKNFDYNRLYNLEIDSHPSVYFLLKMMEKFGATKVANEISDNSARLVGRPNLKETTSYYSPWFVVNTTPSLRDTPPSQGGDIAIDPSLRRRGLGGGSVAFLFFGDMMLDRNVKKQIDTHGADWIFSELAGGENRFFMGMDFVHANLEGPFADKRRATSKSIAFRFDPALIPTLQKYNFNIFTIANNHSLDMGKAGLKESAKNLTAASIDFYGDGYDIGADAIKIKEVAGMKIAFVGFNDTYFRLDNEKIQATIKKARCPAVVPAQAGIQSSTTGDLDSRLRGNDKCGDVVIVNIHWGDEYKEISNTRQRTLAHLMIDAGADIIIGHHPHVVEEMEIYKNRPIFYSLGNFVFDQYFSVPTQQGLAVGAVITSPPAGGGVGASAPGVVGEHSLSVYVFPLQSVKSQTQQMGYETGIKYMQSWVAKSRLNGYNFNTLNNLIISY